MRSKNRIIILNMYFESDGINISLNKPVEQTKRFASWFAWYAGDGDPTTCSHSEEVPNPWWVMDFRALVRIHSMQITNRNIKGRGSVYSLQLDGGVNFTPVHNVTQQSPPL